MTLAYIGVTAILSLWIGYFLGRGRELELANNEVLREEVAQLRASLKKIRCISDGPSGLIASAALGEDWPKT